MSTMPRSAPRRAGAACGLLAASVLNLVLAVLRLVLEVSGDVKRRTVYDFESISRHEQQGWGPDFVVKTQSRITGPVFAGPRPLLPVTLLGTAFAGDRGVSKVEVSGDDGRIWQPATITFAGSRLTWSLWSYSWTPTRTGEQTLVVRAVDGAGVPQIQKEKSSGPEGASGYHRVPVTIG